MVSTGGGGGGGQVGAVDPNMLGEYFPLEHSYSWKDRPGGMEPAEAETLRKNHILFGEPTSPLLVPGGFRRPPAA